MSWTSGCGHRAPARLCRRALRLICIDASLLRILTSYSENTGRVVSGDHHAFIVDQKSGEHLCDGCYGFVDVAILNHVVRQLNLQRQVEAMIVEAMQEVDVMITELYVSHAVVQTELIVASAPRGCREPRQTRSSRSG